MADWYRAPAHGSIFSSSLTLCGFAKKDKDREEEEEWQTVERWARVSGHRVDCEV